MQRPRTGLAGVRRAGRPHPARHGRSRADGRGRGQSVRARGPLRRLRPGGLQAPQGARGRRPGQPQPRRTAPAQYLEAEVFDLMTKWIERYRRQAEERFTRTRRRAGGDGRRARRPSHHPRRGIMTSNSSTPPTGSSSHDRGRPAPAHLSDRPRLRRAAGEGLFRAWIDRNIVARWMGPRSIEMDIHAWDATTGGHYRYDAVQEGEVSVVLRVVPRGCVPLSGSCRPSPGGRACPTVSRSTSTRSSTSATDLASTRSRSSTRSRLTRCW